MESGGDNLTATFSPALVDAQIFVIDVAGGGDVARKGGPGIARADLLVVNKTDLAPYVGVDVEQMLADAGAVRDGRPVIALSRPSRIRERADALGARSWRTTEPANWCRPTPVPWRRTSTHWTTGPATQSTTSTHTAMTTTSTRTDPCSVSLVRTTGGRCG